MTELLVDGNSLFARCWFAVKEDLAATRRLFVQSILQLLDQSAGRINMPIDRTLFGWDGRSKTDKHRKPKPQAYVDARLRVQRDIVPLFGTVHSHHPEFEADDIVATAVFNSRADQIFVVSGDKDLMQLQGDSVSYYCLNAKCVIPARTICRKFAIKQPAQVAIALAVIGDRGDGVDGIPKWGPKKVEKLFEAVTEAMRFEEAMAAVLAQIPVELQPYFLDSLDKTLLHTDVPGVPEPSPLRFCSSLELSKLGINDIAQAYERVALQYDGGEEALESLIGRSRGSRSAEHHPSRD